MQSLGQHMPLEIPAFQQHQLALTAHIRDPQHVAQPAGIEPRRIAVYRDLLYNGIESHLVTNFPVLRGIIPDQPWHQLVRDFFIRHHCRTGLFTQIGLEFITYLEQEREPQSDDWPFMLELAHYEYVELAVSINDVTTEVRYDPNGDLLTGRPLIAPTAWNLSYCYPVHRIGPDYLPQVPPEQPTHLVVYRDRLDQVHFLEINALTQHVLTTLQANPQMTGQALLHQMAETIQPHDLQPILQAGATLLADLRQRNILLGSVHP